MKTSKSPVVDEIIAALLEEEGGWVNDPADLGGPTNHGITLQKLAQVRGREVSIAELQNLTTAEAAEIYRDDYVHGPKFDQIADAELAGLIVDSGVHHGQEQAAKWLKRALGVPADGALGPVTLAALAKADPQDVGVRVIAQRVRLMGDLITRKPNQAKFAKGWLDRAADFLDDSAF